MVKIRQEIKEEARKLQICALYSSKGHFYAAGWWKVVHYVLGIPLTALGVFTAVENSNIFGTLSGICVAVLSGLITFLNPNSTSSAHFASGKAYDVLYNKTRQFAQLDCSDDSGVQDVCLKEELARLYEQKYELDDNSLKISQWAYKKAKRGIENGEADYNDTID